MKTIDKLNGIFSEKPHTTKKIKGTGRKPPEIVQEHIVLKGNQNGGKNHTAINYKAFKLIIDGVEITEELLYKLATAKYPQFNCKKLVGCVKGEPTYSLYIYCPSEMLKEHEIQIVYRRKMVQRTYWLSGQAPVGAEVEEAEGSEEVQEKPRKGRKSAE